MVSSFQIEKISYDLISRAINLNNIEKSTLFGNYNKNKFVAAKIVGNGFLILMQTLGRRDECSTSLKQLLAEGSY